jgi:hypothetical protein
MRETDHQSLSRSLLWLHHELVLFIAEIHPYKIMGFSLSLLADFFEGSQEIYVLLPLIEDQALKGVHSDLYLL